VLTAKTSSASSHQLDVVRPSTAQDDKGAVKFATSDSRRTRGDSATGATIVPIYQTSTFTQTKVGEQRLRL